MQGRGSGHRLFIEGLIFFKGTLLYIYESSIRMYLITDLHRGRLATHLRRTKTFQQLSLIFFWPIMGMDVNLSELQRCATKYGFVFTTSNCFIDLGRSWYQFHLGLAKDKEWV